jgi:acyl-CoA thioester hydrolase
MADTTPLKDRALFRAWTQEICRFRDTDRLGHVNNAVFATFCESGRVAFLWGGDSALTPPEGTAYVIARLVLDFRAELQYADVVDIGTGVLQIGRSSFTLAQGLFRGSDCVATAHSVLVLMDEATRRATPLPPSVRERMAAFALPGAGQG